MSGTQQIEALRFAEMLDKYSLNPLREASAELRRQQARIEELEGQLEAIGAGGVEPLRKLVVVPQGWTLVAVEPTEKMIGEGGCAQALKDGHRYIGECAAKTAWSFMLAATPQPPACWMY